MKLNLLISHIKDSECVKKHDVNEINVSARRDSFKHNNSYSISWINNGNVTKYVWVGMYKTFQYL